MIQLSGRGSRRDSLQRLVIGVATTTPLPPEMRQDRILVSSDSDVLKDTVGYAGVITTTTTPDSVPQTPFIDAVKTVNFVRDGHIIHFSSTSGHFRVVYRPESSHNILFITDRCNSNCLMCSQPPIDRPDDEKSEVNRAILRLVSTEPQYLGISGGEPTLSDSLLAILEDIKLKYPNSIVHMLSNGRRFAWPDYTRRFVDARPPRLTVGIPLYSNIAPEHDYVVQASGAFDQTVLGIHQLGRWGHPVEIRVVVHQQTAPRLRRISEYIWRNLPFVKHVTFMGLEMMGYTPKNLDLLWIDPVDYQESLSQAAEYLASRGLHVSIYNHQLCVLQPDLWPFARQSISDYKNIYVDECSHCSALERCGGLFKSALRRHSRGIKALT